MADFRLNLMERFPEYKQVIERLLDSHTDFNSKAHEFTEVQDQLRQAETTGDSPQDAERLRTRHEALRDELIARMDRLPPQADQARRTHRDYGRSHANLVAPTGCAEKKQGRALVALGPTSSLAPGEGFEPPTGRLTAACSTAELPRIRNARSRTRLRLWRAAGL